MTRVLPTLTTDLTKATTYDLMTYLNTRLAEREEEITTEDWVESDRSYEERLSDITTELLRRSETDRPETS